MITEDYVSFETAQLLKEKGFDAQCRSYFINDLGDYRKCAVGITNRNCSFEQILRPTHQMAIKWLREEKNIIVNVWYNGVDWDAEYYNNKDENFYLITDSSYNSYEQAVEVALKYTLEKLI